MGLFLLLRCYRVLILGCGVSYISDHYPIEILFRLSE